MLKRCELNQSNLQLYSVSVCVVFLFHNRREDLAVIQLAYPMKCLYHKVNIAHPSRDVDVN